MCRLPMKLLTMLMLTKPRMCLNYSNQICFKHINEQHREKQKIQ